jgi:hypothetical protein
MAILNFWSTPKLVLGLSWSWSYGSWIYNYLCNQCLSPLTLWVRIQLKRGGFDTTLCDNVCQWLAAGQWFSPGTPVSSTNNIDRHEITEILLKVVLNAIPPHQKKKPHKDLFYSLVRTTLLPPRKLSVRRCFLTFSRYKTKHIFTPSVCFRRTVLRTPHW